MKESEKLFTLKFDFPRLDFNSVALAISKRHQIGMMIFFQAKNHRISRLRGSYLNEIQLLCCTYDRGNVHAWDGESQGSHSGQ